MADSSVTWPGWSASILWAIQDCYSNKIVGYAIDSHMRASLAVSALRKLSELNFSAVRTNCVTEPRPQSTKQVASSATSAVEIPSGADRSVVRPRY